MKKEPMKYFDRWQFVIVVTIAASFGLFFLLFIFRLLVLDDLPKRDIVDSLMSINSALHILAWGWFIVRSITYGMRLKEARKEEEDI